MEEKKPHRLSWSEQSPQWQFFPTMKQIRGRDGWFPTGYRDGIGTIWCLMLLGTTCQFRDVGSPSDVRH